jgi:hypothetical protein
MHFLNFSQKNPGQSLERVNTNSQIKKKLTAALTIHWPLGRFSPNIIPRKNRSKHRQVRSPLCEKPILAEIWQIYSAIRLKYRGLDSDRTRSWHTFDVIFFRGFDINTSDMTRRSLIVVDWGYGVHYERLKLGKVVKVSLIRGRVENLWNFIIPVVRKHSRYRHIFIPSFSVEIRPSEQFVHSREDGAVD